MIEHNKKQRKGNETTKEKRMRIQGYVNVIDLADSIKLFNGIDNMNIRSRSDLINMCVQLAGSIARKNFDGEDIPTKSARDAFRILERNGITWSSERANKKRQRILEYENMQYEGVKYSDPYQENMDIEKTAAEVIKRQKEKKKARRSSDGNVVGMKPGMFKSEEELDD